MRYFDKHGAQIVGTCTKQEREAMDDLEPVHFVMPEYMVGVGDE